MIRSHNTQFSIHTEVVFTTISMLLVGIIGYVPALILTREKVADPYFNTIISQSLAGFEDGIIVPLKHADLVISDPNQQGHLGYNALILAISKTGGVPPNIVRFLPIGGLILPLLYFILAKKISGSNLAAIFLALYVAYEPMLSQGHYNVHVYVWARCLFIVFLLLCVNILDGQINETIMILTMVYAGTFLIYWTVPIWMLTIWGIITVVLLLRKRLKSVYRKSIQNVDWALFLAFIVIYLGFSKVLYQYLADIAGSVYGGPNDGLNFFGWQLMRLLGGSQAPGPYEFVGGTTENSTLLWVLVVRYLVLVAPLFLYILTVSMKTITSKFSRDPFEYKYAPLILGGFAAVVVHVVIYLTRGHVSLRPALLIFPLVGILCILEMNKQTKFVVGFASILAFLSIIGFALNLKDLRSNVVRSSADWFLNHFQGSTALMDLNTAHEYLIVEAEEDLWIANINYDSTNYSYFLETTNSVNLSGNSPPNWDFAIVDLKNIEKPILSTGWKTYEPLESHFDEILLNERLNMVYSDGYYAIFHYRK